MEIFNVVNRTSVIPQQNSKQRIPSIKQSVQDVNQHLQKINADIEFKYNDKINTLVVQIINKKTNEVIREIPPKELIKIAEKMKEFVGMLFDMKG